MSEVVSTRLNESDIIKAIDLIHQQYNLTPDSLSEIIRMTVRAYIQQSGQSHIPPSAHATQVYTVLRGRGKRTKTDALAIINMAGAEPINNITETPKILSQRETLAGSSIEEFIPELDETDRAPARLLFKQLQAGNITFSGLDELGESNPRAKKLGKWIQSKIA